MSAVVQAEKGHHAGSRALDAAHAPHRYEIDGTDADPEAVEVAYSGNAVA